MTDLNRSFIQAAKELVTSPTPVWYNINTDHPSPFDLWNALGLSPDEFHSLLAGLGWVSVRKTGDVVNVIRYKPKAIERFVVSNRDTPYDIELDRTKTKFFGLQLHFLRLGVYKDASFSVSQQFDENWLNGYRVNISLPIASLATIQQLKSFITPLRTTSENLEDNQLTKETVAASINPNPVTISQNETFSERLQASIEEEIAALSWSDLLMLRSEPKETLGIAFAEVLVRQRNKKRAKRIAEIFGETPSVVDIAAPSNKERPNTPKLDQYNIPNDDREHELLLRELILMKQGSNRSCRAGNLTYANGVTRDIVVVPRSGKLRVNEELIRVVLESLELEVGSLVAICCRLDKELFVNALQDVKLAPPGRLSVDQLAGMMKKANLSQGQMRIVRRFLHQWLHCKIFPSEHCLLKSFAEHGFAPYLDVAVIDGRSYFYSYKLPDELLEFHVVRYLEQSKANPEEARCIDKIELVILADHGKGAFRMICSFLYYKGNTLAFKEHASCGNVEISEDSVRAMQLTFVSKVNESLRSISDAGSVVVQGEYAAYSANLANRDEEEDDMQLVTVIPVTCHLNGDIKFLANCLGKERMAGKHCYKCRLSPKEWSDPSHLPGIPWCQATLKEKWEEIAAAEELGQRLQPTVVRGVTGPALIDSIPVSRVGIPQLHLELGLGNQILYKRILRDYVVPLFVRLNDTVFDAKRSYYVATKAVWAATHSILDSTSMKRLVKEQSVAKKAHAEALSKAKYLRDPIVIHIEQNILAKYNIKRSCYHGGDPEGTACRALFSNANDVMKDLANYLRQLHPVFPITHQNINAFFTGNSRLLQHLDAITSFSRTIGISATDIQECQRHVRRFCRLWRSLGYSVEMVKFHLIEDHLIDAIQDGNAARLEDPIEQFHQTAAKFEKRSSMRDGPRKHIMFSNAEKRDCDIGVDAIISQTMEETGRLQYRAKTREERQSMQAERSYKRAHLLTLPEIEQEDAFDVEKLIISGLSSP